MSNIIIPEDYDFKEHRKVPTNIKKELKLKTSFMSFINLRKFILEYIIVNKLLNNKCISLNNELKKLTNNKCSIIELKDLDKFIYNML